MPVCAVDYVRLDGEIIMDKFSRVMAVRINSAYPGGRHKHVFRLFPGEKIIYRRLIGKVELGMGLRNDIAITRFLQAAADGRTNQPAMPSYKYFRVFLHLRYSRRRR